jgi:hypothetical protein
MPEVWIGFNSRDRQRYWWRTGILTLALAGVMVAMSLTTLPRSEVVRVEKRQRVSRSGIWWDLRVIRAHGRSLTIPGTLTYRVMHAEPERKQAVIQERCFLAIGG